MKTKAMFIGLWAGLLFMLSAGATGVSQNSFSFLPEPLYYSFEYRYLFSEPEIELEDWMLSFSGSQDDSFSSSDLKWLDVYMGTPCFCNSDDHQEIPDWLIQDYSMAANSANKPVMEWMLGFEPEVERALLNFQSDITIESWMVDVADGWGEVEYEIEVADWMLAEDIEESDRLIDVEDWMLNSFFVE
ncbi:hypothetical protein ACT3CD_12350 [Geofilum sp. OHC36d9]|uniref:hypothetical protein n=1 Tax=Geofilum sp. OHC36d9 TaxID=3458413 RepID=UPI004033ABC4